MSRAKNDYLVMLHVQKRGNRLPPQWRAIQAETLNEAVREGVHDWPPELGKVMAAGARLLNCHSTGTCVVAGSELIGPYNDLCKELGLPQRG